MTAGNGCVMRLAPVPMFFYPDRGAMIEESALSCTTTHGATDCLDSARVLAATLAAAFAGDGKDSVLRAAASEPTTSSRLAEIAAGRYVTKHENDIRGSGYVVDCLEAALWCFAVTPSYEEAVLRAANLGEDADTTAAVCGQIAGAFYGERAIPAKWLGRLHMGDHIGSIAEQLLRQ